MPGYVLERLGPVLSDKLGRQVEIGALHLNPYTLTARLEQVRIAGPSPGAPAALELGAIDASVSPRSLFHWAPVLSHLSLEAPVVRIARDASGRLDFQDIVDHIAATPSTGATPRLALDNIRVANGHIIFDDGVTRTHHEIDQLQVGIPFISTIPHDATIEVQPVLSGRLDNNPFELTARTRPFAAGEPTVVSFASPGIDLPEYLPFVPPAYRPHLERARLVLDLQLAFDKASDGTARMRLSGSAILNDLRLANTSGAQALSFDRLAVALHEFDLTTGKVDFDRIELDAPHVTLVRDAAGSFGLPELLPSGTTTASHQGGKPLAQAASDSGPNPSRSALPYATVPPAGTDRGPKNALDLTVRHLQIGAGTLDVSDGRRRLGGFSDLAATLDGFSTTSQAPGHFTFAYGATGSPEVSLKGALTYAQHQISAHADLSHFALAPLAAFATFPAGVELKGGELQGQADALLDWSASPLAVKLTQTTLELDHLRIEGARGVAPAAAQSLRIENLDADTATQHYHIERVAAAGLDLSVVRDLAGGIEVQPLAGAAGNPARAEGRGPMESKLEEKPRAVASVSARHGPATPDTPGAPSTQPLKLAIDHVEMSGSHIAYNDSTTPTPVGLNLDQLAVHLDHLQLPGSEPAALLVTAHANKTGTIAIKGKLTPLPFVLDADIKAQAVPVAPLVGYAQTPLNITIAKAALSTQGHLHVGGSTPLRYHGRLAVTDFSALDKVTSASFLRWKSLAFSRVDVDVPGGERPVSVALGDVALDDFYSRLIVYPDGRLNLQSVLATGKVQSVTSGEAPTAEASENPPGSREGSAHAVETHSASSGVASGAAEPAATGPAGSAPAPRISVASIKLSNGTVNYTDNFIRPNYTTNIDHLEGSVGAVSSTGGPPAPVSLRGSLEGNGDLAVSGSINPLSHPIFVDLSADATNIELTRLSAYSAKYAGYNIEKGKLSMKVHYHIENNQLDAQNHLFLNQLTFGDHVDSPDATKLPVLLAVSLLKDRNGEINVDLPVSGSLNDPQFSIGGVIVRVILNLLEKAVLSPFSLLGSIAGPSAPDLGTFTFAPGQFALTPDSEGKVGKIAAVMADRPAIKLDLTGEADPATDRDAARRARLSARVRGEKFREVLKSDPTATFANVTVSAEEYPRYLSKLYDDMDFAKPKNVLGLTKSLPVPEMETLILANMPVNDDDLVRLADERALSVRDALVKAGVDPGRLFLRTPRLITEPPKDGSPCRVVLGIS